MSNEIKNTAKNAPESLSAFYLYNEREDGKYAVTGLKKGIPANITVPSCVTELANFAFQGSNLDSVTFENGTESIGEYAFILSSVKEIHLPDSLKCIKNNAFENCYELQRIVLPECLEEIGENAFTGCDSLTEVVIPASVKKIDDCAFSLCSNLKAIYCEAEEQPEGWSDRWISLFHFTNIFWGYKKAENETSPRLPEKICSDKELFDYTELEDGSIIINGFKRYNKIMNADGEYDFIDTDYDFDTVTTVEFPENTAFISSSAFLSCGSIRKLIFPDSLLEIGSNAFSGCAYLEEVALPEGLLTIGNGTFENCPSLKELTLPNSILNLGENVLSGYPDQKINNLPQALNPKLSVSAKNDYLIGNEHILSALKNTMVETAIIPEEITRIGKHAFKTCYSLTTVILSKNVTEIDDLAFSYCPNFTNFEVDKNNTAYTAIDGVLYTKDKTRLVRYPLGRSGDYTVPDGVKFISKNAFEDCIDLDNVILPSSIVEDESGISKMGDRNNLPF